MRKFAAIVLVVAITGFAWLSLPDPGQPQAPGTAWPTATGSGLVVAIDRDKGVVTISHGPLPALNMMAMTMGFPVKDKDQLSRLQPMQKVEFRLVFDGNDYLITDIK
jgi:Cu(I)/Ag(I) efflux system protein CusF